MFSSYRNQSIDLLFKSIDRFLYGCTLALIVLKSKTSFDVISMSLLLTLNMFIILN